MMQMMGPGGMGSRRRYLAEQAAFMEETFGKAEGFTTPITKPAASFKAPSAGTGGAPKPKVASLKPTGNILPSPTARLSALKQNMVGQTGPSTGAPTAAAGAVGKRLRRKGQFQRLKPSTVAKSFIGGVAKPISHMSAAERQQVRAGVALDRRFRPAEPLHRRGAPAEHNAGNKSLRELAQMTRGGEKSSNPKITFGRGVSAADRERVLRIAPKRLKGGPVHVDHYPHQGSIFDAQPEGYVAGGSRRVPSALHLKRGTGDHTIAHEFTHANRKSLNAWRIKTITHNPTKLGREEGRADAGAYRRGYRRAEMPTGAFDYEQLATLSSSKNRLYRWGNKKLMKPMAGKAGDMDRKAYIDVRNRMNAPINPRLQPGNEKLIRGARRSERLDRATTYAPYAPAAVGLAMLPHSIRQQKKKEAEAKAKAAAARKARRSGVSKGLPTHGVHPSFGKVRVLGQHSKDRFMVVTNRDDRRLLHRNTLTFTNKGTTRKPKPDNGQMSLFDKALRVKAPKGTSASEVRAAYKEKGYTTSAGTPRRLGHGEAGKAAYGNDVRHYRNERAEYFRALRSQARQMEPRRTIAGVPVVSRGALVPRKKIGPPPTPPKGYTDPIAEYGGVGLSSTRRVGKREPLKTSVSEDDARKLVDRHGLKGPLPKGLDREQKMAAYEARYVSAGGKKAEKWDRRARVADKVKTGGLGVATAGGAGWLASRGRLKSRLSPKVQHHTETVAGAGAVAGGAGELYAAHARRKRSSYASAPAGVARSALTRMRDYTP